MLVALIDHAQRTSDFEIQGAIQDLEASDAAAAVFLVDALEMAAATGEGSAQPRPAPESLLSAATDIADIIERSRRRMVVEMAATDARIADARIADTEACLVAMTEVAASVTARWQERQICAALQPILYTDERDPACLAAVAAQVIRDARARVAELELKGPGEMDPGGWRPSDLLPRGGR